MAERLESLEVDAAKVIVPGDLTDVAGDDDVVPESPFSFQCKVCEKWRFGARFVGIGGSKFDV